MPGYVRPGEVLEYGEGGNGVDALGFHEAHGLIAQLRGMVDGGDAGLRRVEGSGLAHRMHGDTAAPARGLLDTPP